MGSSAYSKTQAKIPARSAPPGPDAASTPTTGLPKKGKEGGPREGSPAAVSNADFVAALFPSFSPDARAAVCTKQGDPDETEFWIAEDASEVARRCIASRNNYLNSSSFIPPADGKFSVQQNPS